eukprot:Nitzschia sp. Nitz4//scaffold158_size52425//39829//42123//NITZ4_006862-RA/size52425-processed-gene-0.40-mRNA-1//1//CDS//3329537522//404//frame0
MSRNEEEEEPMPPPPALGLVEQTSLSVQHSRISAVLLPEDQLLSMTQNLGDEEMGDHLPPSNRATATAANSSGKYKPKSGASISQMVEQELNSDGRALTREEQEKQKNLEQQAPTWSAGKDTPNKEGTAAPVVPQPLPSLASRSRSTSRGNRSDTQGETSLLESLPENDGDDDDDDESANHDGENSEGDEDSCAPPQTSMDRQITDVSALTEDPALHGPSSRSRTAVTLTVSEGSAQSDVLASTTAVSRSELEEQVRRRILSEAVPAQVVPMTIRTSNGSNDSIASTRNASNTLSSPLHMQPGVMGTGPDAPQNPLHSKDPEDPLVADATYTSQTTDATGNNLCLADVNPAEDPKDAERRRKFRIKVATMIAFVVIFVIAIVVGVLFARSKDDDDFDGKPPKHDSDSRDDNSRTESEALYQFLLQHGSEDIAIRGTPAERAFKWLERNDIFSGADVILEYFALVTFYYATNGDYWTNNTGWLDTEVSPCDWYPGTNCERLTMEVNDDDVPSEDDDALSERVLSLNLVNNNLFGTIPAELGRLTTLFSLFLQDNADLTGTLPTELGELDSLEYLDLSRCAIKGEFSEEFLDMTHESLVVFKMEDVVTMTGTLPISLVRSHTMKVLNLNNMGLRAQWPGDVLIGPHQIYLSGNRLSGKLTISDSRLFSWLDVTHLDLSYNSLSGAIPDAIGSMWANGTLVSLRLEGNDFDTDDDLSLVNATVCEAYTASDKAAENRTFVMDCFHEDYDCPCCTECCERGGFNCGPN